MGSNPTSSAILTRAASAGESIDIRHNYRIRPDQYRDKKDPRMAHFQNNIVESLGLVDPEFRPSPPSTLSWLARLPTIVDALRSPETVTPAVALLVEMARAADASEKAPGA